MRILIDSIFATFSVTSGYMPNSHDIYLILFCHLFILNLVKKIHFLLINFILFYFLLLVGKLATFQFFT